MSGYPRGIIDQRASLNAALIEKPFTKKALLDKVRSALES
jgi:hypothetical protein